MFVTEEKIHRTKKREYKMSIDDYEKSFGADVFKTREKNVVVKR